MKKKKKNEVSDFIWLYYVLVVFIDLNNINRYWLYL